MPLMNRWICGTAHYLMNRSFLVTVHYHAKSVQRPMYFNNNNENDNNNFISRG